MYISNWELDLMPFLQLSNIPTYVMALYKPIAAYIHQSTVDVFVLLIIYRHAYINILPLATFHTQYKIMQL